MYFLVLQIEYKEAHGCADVVFNGKFDCTQGIFMWLHFALTIVISYLSTNLCMLFVLVEAYSNQCILRRKNWFFLSMHVRGVIVLQVK